MHTPYTSFRAMLVIMMVLPFQTNVGGELQFGGDGDGDASEVIMMPMLLAL